MHLLAKLLTLLNRLLVVNLEALLTVDEGVEALDKLVEHALKLLSQGRDALHFSIDLYASGSKPLLQTLIALLKSLNLFSHLGLKVMEILGVLLGETLRALSSWFAKTLVRALL